MSRYIIMSNRSSCRILRFLGMDGFLGFKCGPSCSEKQHNKEIKALIDAIDDLLAYDSKTKKELGATEPGVNDAKWRRSVTGKLDGIKGMANDLRGTHTPRPDSSVQPRGIECDTALQRLSATAASVRRRTMEAYDPQGWALLEKERWSLTSHGRYLEVTHGFFPENILVQ